MDPMSWVAGLRFVDAALGLPFVTVDLVMRRHEVWRVVELGDGQVNDRPATTPADELIPALLAG